MRQYYRFAVVTLNPDASLAAPLPDCQGWSRVSELGDGTALLEISFDHSQWNAWQDSDGAFLLPSLSAPADDLEGRPAQFFQKHSIAARKPSDTVLNLLRSLRNTKGFRFKIDNEI